MYASPPAERRPRGRLGCWIALVAVPVLLVAAPLAWFALFPPFPDPETGHLQAEAQSTIRLSPDEPVAGLLVEVHHPDRIFGDARSNFSPTRMSIALDGETPGLSVDIYPATAGVLTDLASSSDEREVGWRIDCAADAIGEDCTRSYLAVISGTPSTDVSVEVAVVADLLFPNRSPTPFLVGIDLRLEQLDLRNGPAPFSERIAGGFELGPDAPVTVQPLNVAGSRAVGELGGVVVSAEIEPIEEPVPTGFGAPPPVVLSVIDSDGTLLSELEMRAGEAGRIAIPALADCATERCDEQYSLVGRWRDLADQRYAVRWDLRSANSTGNGAELEAPAPVQAEAIGREALEGTTTVMPNRDVDAPGMGWEVAELLPDHLPAAAGVFRLSLTLDEADEPVTVTLSEDVGHGVVLRPGVETAVVMDPFWDCRPAYRCYVSWFELATRDGSGRVMRDLPESVTVRWHAQLEVFELDPLSSAVPEIKVLEP